MRRKPTSWIFWVPVLLVGAVIYWTVALGAAGISLVAVGVAGDEESDGQSDDATQVESTALPVEGVLANEEQIPVRLQEEATDPRPALSPTVVEPMPGSRDPSDRL